MRNIATHPHFGPVEHYLLQAWTPTSPCLSLHQSALLCSQYHWQQSRPPPTSVPCCRVSDPLLRDSPCPTCQLLTAQLDSEPVWHPPPRLATPPRTIILFEIPSDPESTESHSQTSPFCGYPWLRTCRPPEETSAIGKHPSQGCRQPLDNPAKHQQHLRNSATNPR